jgi:hypothetical protein
VCEKECNKCTKIIITVKCQKSGGEDDSLFMKDLDDDKECGKEYPVECDKE